jgi:NTP pyrophosphatase (non-canonical NTP hydrolase)
MNELIKQIKQWGYDKGIIQAGSPYAQATKTREECDELIDAIHYKDPVEVVDAIGDIFVTLVLQCAIQEIEIEDCIRSAYNVIAERNGKLKDGIFIKD